MANNPNHAMGQNILSSFHSNEGGFAIVINIMEQNSKLTFLSPHTVNSHQLVRRQVPVRRTLEWCRFCTHSVPFRFVAQLRTSSLFPLGVHEWYKSETMCCYISHLPSKIMFESMSHKAWRLECLLVGPLYSFLSISICIYSSSVPEFGTLRCGARARRCIVRVNYW